MLGLLVGLQRERAEEEIGGLRTFGVVCVLGAACGLMSEAVGGWVLGAGLVSLAGLIVAAEAAISARLREERRGRASTDGGGTEDGAEGGANGLKALEPDRGRGLTTEVAMLTTFAVGAMTVLVGREVAAAVGGGMALLLYFKKSLHAAVRGLGEEDVRAIMQFALVSLVILPIAPNRTMGPLDVINPRQVWFMVVLIVGMSLAAYLASKFMDRKKGTLVGGLLGGLISSTATAAAMARGTAGSAGARAAMISLASGVVFVRLLVEVYVVAREEFWQIAPAVLVMLGVSMGCAFALWRFAGRDGAPEPVSGNPSRMRTAIVFALLYAGVTLAVAWARQSPLGRSGVYGVAALSGLTDMDAITLSSARLAAEGRLMTGTAWRAIVIASMANLAFKTGIVVMLGGVGFAARATWPMLATLGAGVVVLVVGWLG